MITTIRLLNSSFTTPNYHFCCGGGGIFFFTMKVWSESVNSLPALKCYDSVKLSSFKNVFIFYGSTNMRGQDCLCLR